ncbi:MAG: PilT/PilU family type 4a pilus ATPase [Candidatus Omnitrophica bacterium]|nr:PilT/PilU family type 4a pilus ATPase [Candidatus Omnitrophota bacterium]
MHFEEKRKSERFRFKHLVQYEKLLDDGSFDIPYTVYARDVSITGISFYSVESMKINSKVRVAFELEKKKISFMGQVVRMEIVEGPQPGFMAGVHIEKIDDEVKKWFTDFIRKINIYNVLKDMDFYNVVDIHFVAGYPPIIKKIGELSILKSEPISEAVMKIMLFNLLDDERSKQFIEEKETNFVFHYKDNIRFRVNLHVQQGKVEAVFRLIPDRIQLPHQLGLPVPVEQLIMENRNGLILIAGRTGSGKSTTLASMIEFLNNKRMSLVITIEKPIEYIHTNKTCIIKQREVGKDTLSFSNAARNALRQSPDVLLIGEILDPETMEVAITAAETGMLVISSIHAADSSQALDRIISFFPAELQKHMLTRLSLILKGIVTQSLLPQKDSKKLIVASEVMLMNSAMRRVVRDGDFKQIPTIIQMNGNIGMQSMRSSIEQCIAKGLVDIHYLQE